MQKYLWGGLAVTVLALTVTFWSFKSVVSYRRLMPKDIPRNLPTDEQYALIEQKLEEKTPSPRNMSKAVARQTAFDFGMMDPHAESSHTFVIRNEGTEVLKLGDPDSHCECATAELSAREILPGSSADVTLFWTPEDKTGPFGVSVDIPTSDPAQSRLSFNVSGIVRRRLNAEPGALVFPDVVRGKSPPPAETLIYSHVWKEFRILSVSDKDGSLAGFEWSVAPADPAQISEKQALAGYQLNIKLPADMPSGPIRATLELLVEVPGESAPLPYEIVIGGHVRGLLTIHGAGIDAGGVVDLGIVQRGSEKRLKLLLKVRDAETQLANPRWEAEPGFVQAKLLPLEGVPGVYSVEIVIPPTAPAATHMRDDQWGTLTLLTDHPRIPETKLRLRFAVAGRDTGALP